MLLYLKILKWSSSDIQIFKNDRFLKMIQNRIIKKKIATTQSEIYQI
jgi:hypothetical protein